MKIVHIGFPKTATTFLQWEVFPRFDEINFVDYNACRKIFPQIIYQDKIDLDLEASKASINQYCDHSCTNLFSFEALCGQPFGGVKGMNRSSIAGILRQCGFEKVIITVRDPVKAIDSYYRQYVIHGGTHKFKNFVDLENNLHLAYKHFNLSYLRYEKLIEVYLAEFGKQNVLVLSQEALKNDFVGQIAQIKNFVGCSFDFDKYETQGKKTANESLTNLSTSILRSFNYFTYNTIRPSSIFGRFFSTRNVWLVLKLVLDPYLFKFISRPSSYVKKFGIKPKLEDYYSHTMMALKQFGIDYTR